MTYFILSLVSFTIVFFIYLAKTKRWKHLGYFLLFVVVFTGVLIYALKVRPYTIRGPESIYQELILSLCTAAGLATNPLYHRIKGMKVPIQWADITKASSITPFIFLFFWGAVEEMAEVTFITYCFAYANGYFWATILKKELRFDLKEFDTDIRERCLDIIVNADNTQNLEKIWDTVTRTALNMIETRVSEISGIKRSASFKLTKQSLENLRKDGIPDKIVESLKLLEKQGITNKENFLNTVKRYIGNEQTDRYKELILKHAKRKVFGRTLITEAFKKNGPLKEKFEDDHEREAYENLIKSMLTLFRNPYSHRLLDRSPGEAGSIILFVNLLLKILEGWRLEKKEDTP